MFRTLADLNSNPDGNNKSCKEKIVDYWNSIPLMIKIVISSTVIFYVLSYVLADFVILLVNIPEYTIYKFRLWTVITTVFITLSLLNIVFAFISWVPSGINDERENGTSAFCINFFMHSILIQIFFTLISFLLGLKSPSTGLWPLIMAEITIKCMKDPDAQMMFFFLPWPIRALYYPWVLVGFFFLLNMGNGIQIDFIIAILYGYLFHFVLKKKLELSITFIQKVEDSFPLKYLKNNSNFITLTNASGSTGFTASTILNRNKNEPSKPQGETFEVRLYK